ncbi:universal stress protein [Natronocalculus amylovorans]|uniref:Universal stress protein n=1 Tax=Natronocalculus amylovorans TaxID=2917812 RepID=A0AAE3FZT4_9EURY|nr:universal stress protein [Natronocalculus amylovorans]MCL9818043.1 universal stress protein [Natronocalculus amylovorans]NUE03964.1 universal stress protein [Halorubraceae archaeon YAN]
MPEEILVPYDGSPLSKEALKYTCAEFGAATITTLYIIDRETDKTASRGWGDHPGMWEEWLEDRNEHARELFEGAQQIADKYSVTLQTGVAVGRVPEMINKAAELYGSDLIIIGLHGQSRLEEILIGEVAKVVVRNATIPVTTVRETVNE